jgi:selT/selW/selH-like putative selenoprotein
LAAEIRTRFPEAQVELIPSKGGRFEVTRDGAPVYEKSKTGRHAQPGEVVALLTGGQAKDSPG